MIAAADAVQVSLNRRAALNAERAGATARAQEAIADGRALVRTIGSVVKRTAYRNPGLMAEWRSAQRVKKKPGPVDRDEATGGGAMAATSAVPIVQEMKAAA